MLRMIERDAKVKTAPERWQDEQSVAFQLVVTFDRRVFESVVDGLFLSSCFFACLRISSIDGQSSVACDEHN